MKLSKNRRYHFLVLLIYFILTIIMTYPLILNFTTSIPGDGYDSWSFLWSLWWTKKSLMDPRLDLYYTDYQFYPNGASLAFHNLTLFNSLISVPLQIFFGLIISFNVIFLLSFILAGYGMFLLIKYLVDDKKIAFISGIAFSFCPYHFAHALGHFDLISIQWIPFFILFLIKTFQENKKINPLIAGIFLAVNSLSSWYYGIFLIIFSLIYIIYILGKKNLNKNFITKLFTFFLTFMIIILPFIYPIITESSGYGKVSLEQVIDKSEHHMKNYYYLIPNPMNPIWGNYFKFLWEIENIGFAESVVFVGYTILFVILISFKKIYKKVKFWIFTCFFFFLLSINPKINFLGTDFISPLYLLFYNYFPFFSSLSSVNRFSILVMFSLIIIFSFALKNFMKKIRGNFHKIPKKTLIYFLISFLILIEFLNIPYLLSNAIIPKIAYEIKNENCTIFNLPRTPTPYSLYLQTVHEKKLLNGYVSRPPSYSQNTLNNISNFIINGEFQKVINTLNNYNVKYITFDKGSAWDSFNVNRNFRKFLAYIRKNKLYEDDNIAIFTIYPYYNELNITFYKNFYEAEKTEINNKWMSQEFIFKWMSQDGTVIINSENNYNASLTFLIQSFYKNRTIDIFLNNNFIQTSFISTAYNNVLIPLNLNKGENFLLFHSRQDCEKPSYYKLSDDERCLGLLFITDHLE